MATIIIENFSIPRTCWECRFLMEVDWRCLIADRSVYRTDQPKPKWCPLKEASE